MHFREAVRVELVLSPGIVMDKVEFSQIDERDRVSNADFAALFAELDRQPPSVLIAHGLERLSRKMVEIRRRDEAKWR